MHLETLIIRAASALAAVAVLGTLFSHRRKAPSDRQPGTRAANQRH